MTEELNYADHRKVRSVKSNFLENFLFLNMLWFCEIDFSFAVQATKPLMEKRRRARINNSLNELKILILEALKRDVSNKTFF